MNSLNLWPRTHSGMLFAGWTMWAHKPMSTLVRWVAPSSRPFSAHSVLLGLMGETHAPHRQAVHGSQCRRASDHQVILDASPELLRSVTAAQTHFLDTTKLV